MSLLWIKERHAFVYHTSGIGRQTKVVFTIDDGKRIAWYIFTEISKVFDIEEIEDHVDGKPLPAYSVVGHPAKRSHFHTRKDREVDQFAVGDYLGANLARAHIKVEFLNNHVYIGMTVFLDNGPENLVLQFDAKHTPMHVRHHEQGYLHLHKVEHYSASAITSKWSFKNTPKYKETVP